MIKITCNTRVWYVLKIMHTYDDKFFNQAFFFLINCFDLFKIITKDDDTWSCGFLFMNISQMNLNNNHLSCSSESTTPGKF